jgi:hypothetical protein
MDNALNPQEFSDLASSNKVQLMDRLAGDLYQVGVVQLPQVAQEYYRLGGRYGKGLEFEKVQGMKAKLEWEAETLRHVISALQSTLKAERIGVYDSNGP